MCLGIGMHSEGVALRMDTVRTIGVWSDMFLECSVMGSSKIPKDTLT